MNGLVTSLYGHTLLIKQIFVAGLLVIAAVNFLLISPQLKRDRLQGVANTNVVTRFGKLIIFELIFAGLLLASVSFLTYIPPAKLAAPTSDLKDSAKVDDLDIGVTISPGRIGQNTFALQISSSGEPLRSAKEVLLRFTPDQENIAPSILNCSARATARSWQKGTYLQHPWRLAGPGHCAAGRQIRCLCKFQLHPPKTRYSERKRRQHQQATGLLLTVGRTGLRTVSLSQ